MPLSPTTYLILSGVDLVIFRFKSRGPTVLSGLEGNMLHGVEKTFTVQGKTDLRIVFVDQPRVLTIEATRGRRDNRGAE
jgi:hypothetical protein